MGVIIFVCCLLVCQRSAEIEPRCGLVPSLLLLRRLHLDPVHRGLSRRRKPFFSFLRHRSQPATIPPFFPFTITNATHYSQHDFYRQHQHHHLQRRNSAGTEATAAAAAEAKHLSPAPRPNQLSYHLALSACARGITGSVSDNNNNNEVNAGSGSRKEQEGDRLLRQAIDTFEAMKSGAGGAPSPDLSTYTEMINVYGR